MDVVLERRLAINCGEEIAWLSHQNHCYRDEIHWRIKASCKFWAITVQFRCNTASCILMGMFLRVIVGSQYQTLCSLTFTCLWLYFPGTNHSSLHICGATDAHPFSSTYLEYKYKNSPFWIHSILACHKKTLHLYTHPFTPQCVPQHLLILDLQGVFQLRLRFKWGPEQVSQSEDSSVTYSGLKGIVREAACYIQKHKEWLHKWMNQV